MRFIFYLLIVGALLVPLFGCGSSGSGGSPPPPPPDFTISVTPTSATVAPGNSTTLQVSVAPENGFSASVTVTVSGLPTGATLSPASPFAMTPGSQQVTVTVPANATNGSFTLNLQGVAGSKQHSANFALQVQQQSLANFAVQLFGSEVSFQQGGSGNEGVGISFNGGGSTNFEVQLAVSGLPSGVQGTFGANPIQASSTTTLNLSAGPTVLANYAPITVTATRTADGVQESGQFSLSVVPPVGTLPAIRSDFVRTDGTPAAAVYDPVHGVVYASNPQMNRVDVISTATHQIVNSVLAPNPTGMDLSLDGKHLIVTSNVQQIVSIDTSSLQVVSRTNVTPTGLGELSYTIPDLIANTSNGTVLLGMTLNSAPPAYDLQQWNPMTGTFTALNAPGIGPWVNQLVRTGSGNKVLVVDYGSDLNVAIYDAASNSFTVSGQSPAGGVLAVAGSPTAEQFAIVGSNGTVIVDSNLNVLGSPPVGGIFWGMVYSPDGTKLYVAMTLTFSACGTNYPVIVTVDTSSFAVLGVAPAFATGSGNECEPYIQAVPLTADSSGLLYSQSSHGVVLDDSVNYQNLLSLPVGPPFGAMGFVDEAALNTPLATQLGQIAYDILPDVWVGNTRGTNIQFSNGPLVAFTAPASPAAGMVNVKTVLPDGWFTLTNQSFSYGSQILFLGGNAGAPQGGANLALIGYGLIGNNNSPTVTIGGQPAKVVASSKYVDFNDSGYNATYPFGDVDEVLVTIPAGAPGPVDITVASGAGTATLPKAFTYLPGVTDYSSSDTFTFILYDPQRHWVYLSAGDHIDVFSADTQQFLAPIVPPTVSGTKQIRGLAMTPDHSRLIAANLTDLSVAIINPDNPSASSAVQVVPSGLPNNPGPYSVAVTSTKDVFVITGSCDSAPVYVLNLSTLQVTTPYNSQLICSGAALWSTAAGDHILMDGVLWSAATNQWTASLCAPHPGSTASADGYWFGCDYTGLDAQMIEHAQSQEPEFFSALLNFPDWQGEKMTASGSILFIPMTPASGTAESSGIGISDTNHGAWLGRILLSEQILGPPMQSSMDYDEAGNRFFLITNKGLTVVEADAAPLSIGYLSPASGPAAGGTPITIRGCGFETGTTVSFGGAIAVVNVVDSRTLQVTTPSGSVGGARVVVQTPDGKSYSLDAAFTYQ